jgi:hypothetical protein
MRINLTAIGNAQQFSGTAARGGFGNGEGGSTLTQARQDRPELTLQTQAVIEHQLGLMEKAHIGRRWLVEVGVNAWAHQGVDLNTRSAHALR